MISSWSTRFMRTNSTSERFAERRFTRGMGPTPAGKIGQNAIVADSAGSMLSLFEADMEEMGKMMANFSS